MKAMVIYCKKEKKVGALQGFHPISHILLLLILADLIISKLFKLKIGLEVKSR